MSKSEQHLPPRIFKPEGDKSADVNKKFINKWIRFEFILGGALLALGGFVLRTTGGEGLLILGSGFLVIAAVRLFYRFQQEEKKKKQARGMDRILFRLKERLNPEYSIALSYPLGDNQKIDYLIAGPGGVFVVQRLEERGYFSGGKEEEYWLQKPAEEAKDKSKLANPILANRQKTNLLKQKLENCPPPLPTVKPENCVTFTYHGVEGPVLEFPEIFKMDELCTHIRSSEETGRLDWETVKDIENYLKFADY